MDNVGIRSFSITKVKGNQTDIISDDLAIEEPLQIRLCNQEQEIKDISITMRTPGNDPNLAIGFLFTEGLLKNRNEYLDHIIQENVITIHTTIPNVDLGSIERHFYTSSSCGVCGKSSIDAIHVVQPDYPQTEAIDSPEISIFSTLPEILKSHQNNFNKTGGIHAAALFTFSGELLHFAEDVGRHNALDKLIGHCFLSNVLPLQRHILLLSGRASFELIQKAHMAGIRHIAAIGAPSSLAVELAKSSGIQLIGFLKSHSMNIYNS